MHRSFCLALCLALLFLASGNFVNTTEAHEVENAAPIAMTSLEEQVFQAINQVRLENQLPPLTWMKDLSEVARSHSADMASRDYFSHISPEGESLRNRISRGGITNWSRLAENIASNQGFTDPAATAVRGWLESPGHLHNILDKTLSETGIGVAADAKGKVYLTQLFAKRKF